MTGRSPDEALEVRRAHDLAVQEIRRLRGRGQLKAAARRARIVLGMIDLDTDVDQLSDVEVLQRWDLLRRP